MLNHLRHAAGFAAIIGLVAPHADAACLTITAPVLEIGAVDCATVWPKLQAVGQFADVFAPPGKTTGVCYVSTGPANALIGKRQVSLTSISGWTSDFVPFILGGKDYLGTVVTRVMVTGADGIAIGSYFTRDTIDLSQIATTGTSAEEDLIVGGTGLIFSASGTYRVTGTPEDPQASKVLLTNLNGLACSPLW
jgi:hypothetical protein